MAKKSRSRPLRSEKDRTGCISGLIRIFDFRHGRSARKLLADRRPGNRHAVEAGSSHTKPLLGGSDVEFGETEVKASVKKLMEKEMSNEQDTKKHITDSEMGAGKPYQERACQARKNCKHLSRSSMDSNEFYLCDLDAIKDLKPDKSYDRSDSKKVSDRIDFEIIMHLLHADFDWRSDAIDEGKLSAAIKIFIDQSSPDTKNFREDGQIQHSRESRDALKNLSTNKDLLLKLLEDPKWLSLKQIMGLKGHMLEEDLRSNSLPRSDFLEEKLADSVPDVPINRKQSHKIFRRRSKSQESFPSIESEKCLSSNKIVILKPGPIAFPSQNAETNVSSPMQSHYAVGDKIQEEKNQFSFTELKRKLKHAIRKERQGISLDRITHKAHLEYPVRHDFDKGVGRESLGWRSPNRNHFYTERFAKSSINPKRGDRMDKPNDTEENIVKESSDHTKPGTSDIYLEAKKHLLKMLSSGDYSAELSSPQLPRTLARILSFHEYNNSTNCSPCKGSQDISVTAESTFSADGAVEIVNEDIDQSFQENFDGHTIPFNYSSEIESCSTHFSPGKKLESVGANRSLSHEDSHPNLEEEGLYSAEDATVSKGDARIKETTNDNQENDEILNASCQANGSCSSIGCGQNGHLDEQSLQDRLQSLNTVTFEVCKTLSSPSPSPSLSKTSVAMKVEDLGGEDRTERPSPVSVLEPLFVEDGISPARTISRPVKLEIQPRQIHFEERRSSGDQVTCVQTSFEDEESSFEYVEAVLLGSGLNWDEYLLRWQSSFFILESTLYDEVELFSSRSHHEQKLLFDCTNEVLEEVCERYFGCFPLTSHAKQNIRPVPVRMDLIREIWEGVEWHLLQYPLPQSLDQLLKKDMVKSSSWLNLRLDIQDIGAEIEDAILDNVIEDTISSFIYGALRSDLVAP